MTLPRFRSPISVPLAFLSLLCAACSDSDRASRSFETRPVVASRLAEARRLAAADAAEPELFTAAQLELLGSSYEPTIRRTAARALRESGTREAWAIPRLLASLHTQVDEQVRLDLAQTLAGCGNWAGLDTLYRLRSEAADPALRNLAAAALEGCAKRAGMSDPLSLWRLWNDGDMDRKLPAPALDAQYWLQLWSTIAELCGEDAEQRATAVFVLSNSGAHAAGPLAAALHEEEPCFAVAAAQCLAGMGPRAVEAGVDLVLALNSPALARAAVDALGRVRYPAAGPALLACLSGERDLDLRCAAAEALGRLALPDTMPALAKGLDPEEPNALRLATATALIQVENSEAAARVALELVRAEGSSVAEAALGRWLEQSAQAGDQRAQAALALWKIPAAPPAIVPTEEERAAQLARRVAAAEALLDSAQK